MLTFAFLSIERSLNGLGSRSRLFVDVNPIATKDFSTVNFRAGYVTEFAGFGLLNFGLLSGGTCNAHGFHFPKCFILNVLRLKLNLSKEGSQISFLISDISFPENFEKSLKSGLSNIYILKQSVWKNGQLVFASDIAVKVIFDLWDELYLVTEESVNNSVDKYSGIIQHS